jgi:hypothetical protein
MGNVQKINVYIYIYIYIYIYHHRQIFQMHFEIIAVYGEKHKKLRNTKCRVTY